MDSRFRRIAIRKNQRWTEGSGIVVYRNFSGSLECG
jgi:hypothetical protein